MKKNHISIILLLTLVAATLSGCGRDLSSNTYTSDSTLNITLKGKVLAKRNIKIKDGEKLGDNSTGALAGALTGGAFANENSKSGTAVVGGAIIGGLAGAALQQGLSSQNGVEYIVQIDRSNLKDDYYEGSRLMRNAIAAVKATGVITIIQGKEGKNSPIIAEGQEVLVILSDNRTRIVPLNGF